MRARLSLGSSLPALAAFLMLAGCSASSQTPTAGAGASSAQGGSGVGPLGGSANGAAGPGDLSGVAAAGGTGSGIPGEECAMVQAETTLTKEPVDIILVLDNSGSMRDELQAVEDNININFASILAASDVDYRVILLSRHRKEVRAESGESSTSICVGAPLSGLACPGPAPVLAERFFHYNEKIESTDSIQHIVDFYRRADSRTGLTAFGYSEWLRVGAKKVFLELTDDDEGLPDDTVGWTVEQFFQQLVTLDPAQFGSDPALPNIVWHSIIGIKEKAVPTDVYQPDEPIEPGVCTGNANPVANAGLFYQDLSRRTGGLRFPICQFQGYDAVFNRIAQDVVVKAQIACDFEIPPPPNNETLILDNIAVTSAGTGVDYQQAASAALCQPNLFYIANNRVYLCPETCDAIKAAGTDIQVLFTCESQVVVK